MGLATWIFSAGVALSLVPAAFAADEPVAEADRQPASTSDTSREPASARSGAQRAVQSASDAAPHDYYADDDSGGGSLDLGGRHSKKKDYFGAHLMGYYDPLSSFSQLVSSPILGTFSSTTTTGSGGMMVLFTLLNSMDFEVSTGFDYLFPVSVQGRQGFTGNYQVTGQNLNIMGIRILQVGYQFTSGSFMLVPYGAVGLYYGRNVATVTTQNQPDSNQITYTKLFSTFTFGARGAVDVAKQHTFTLGLAVEGFMPVKIADQLSQLGTINSEFPGAESALQPNLEFMNNFGVRIVADIRILF